MFPLTPVALLIVAIYFLSSIKILAEYERAVIFRLGRVLPSPKGPGVILVFRPIDRMVRISLRLETLEVPGQDVVTKDNVTLKWRKRTSWGYRRIQGAIANLGYKIARSTIADILRRHGIEPAPERSRKTTWKEFLTQHWELIAAADFFTVEVWTARGLKRFLVLFFLDLSTRRVEIAGIASQANGLWMTQIGRNATDAVDGILNGKRYLIHDRDPLFTTEFQCVLASNGMNAIKLPPQSPNLKDYASHYTSFALTDVTSLARPRSESL